MDNSTDKKDKAATVIQHFFKNIFQSKRAELIQEMQTPNSCITEPIPVGDENVYMYLQQDRQEIPLFNIFNFKKPVPLSITPKITPIQNSAFFDNFYTILQKMDSYGIPILMDVVSKEKIDIYITEKTSFTDNMYNDYIYPYLLYILSNCKFNFDEIKKYFITIRVNFDVSDIVEIHKDNTIKTCLTYVNSPVSTELTFDTKQLKLPWLTCSPIFRFNTINQLYTLCFNDNYIIHTIPLYEMEGKFIHELNNTEGKEDAIIRKDNKMYFNGYENIECLVPPCRKKIPPPSSRKLLMCFIYPDTESNRTRFGFKKYIYKDTFDTSEFKYHVMQYKEEKIELTEDSIRIIMTENTLGKVPQTGGKRKSKRITSKRITSKRITSKRITSKRITSKRITSKRKAIKKGYKKRNSKTKRRKM